MKVHVWLYDAAGTLRSSADTLHGVFTDMGLAAERQRVASDGPAYLLRTSVIHTVDLDVAQ